MTRIPRKRVFKITIAGKESWLEDAEGRCGIEVQHKLVTGKYLGKSVRLIEMYLGGAKAPRLLLKDDELDSEDGENE